jgi:hypothetical protein
VARADALTRQVRRLRLAGSAGPRGHVRLRVSAVRVRRRQTARVSRVNVIADELPCEVLTPDGRLYRRVRAVVTDEGVAVYREANPGDDPELVYRARLTAAVTDLPHPSAPRRRRVYRLTTGDGQVIVNAVAGCLCQYPRLRTYTPGRLAEEVRAGVITVATV